MRKNAQQTFCKFFFLFFQDVEHGEGFRGRWSLHQATRLDHQQRKRNSHRGFITREKRIIHSSKGPPFYIISTLLLVTVTDSHRLAYQCEIGGHPIFKVPFSQQFSVYLSQWQMINGIFIWFKFWSRTNSMHLQGSEASVKPHFKRGTHLAYFKHIFAMRAAL